MQFNFGWFGHAIFKDGKYPQESKYIQPRPGQLGEFQQRGGGGFM